MKKTVLMSAVFAIAGVGLMAGVAMAVPVNFSIEGQRMETTNTGEMAVFHNVFNIDQAFTLDLDSATSTPSFYEFDFASMVAIAKVETTTPLSQEVTAWLNFIVPADRDVSVTGTATGHTMNGLVQPGGVFWDDPVSVVLGNGISFNVELSSAVFDTYELPDVIGLELGWGDITATVTLTSEASAPAPVPEPATMLLFGTGLVGLAGAARRKKAQKK